MEHSEIFNEAFDPKKAKEKGISFEKLKVGGVNVIITHKRGTNNATPENTIEIDQRDLIQSDSSFCLYNPKINKFAAESPENLFYVMGLVVGTVGTSWVQFRNLYPVYAAFVRETDGEDVPIDSIVGLDGKEYSVKRWFYRGSSKFIKLIWKNRQEYYNKIFKEGLINNEFELYRYILRNVSGMAAVKAGFAVQLLAGKLGCLDNINADVYGIPIKISDKLGERVESPSFSTKDGAKSEMLTKKGETIVKDYISFLKVIGKVASSEYSQRLWDDWVQIAAAKSIYAQSHQNLKLNLVDGRSVIMPTYKSTTNEVGYQDHLKSSVSSSDPYGGMEIGKDHYLIPKMSAEIDNALNRVK